MLVSEMQSKNKWASMVSDSQSRSSKDRTQLERVRWQPTWEHEELGVYYLGQWDGSTNRPGHRSGKLCLGGMLPDVARAGILHC